MRREIVEKINKRIAAAALALAIIAAVVCGIVFASYTSPTIPSGEGSSSLSAVDATIASDVNIGSIGSISQEDDASAQERWNMPDAPVTWISNESDLTSYLHSGSTGDYGSGTIGVLTQDIVLNTNSQSKLGVNTFRGVLDGNGYTLSLNVTTSDDQIGAISSYAYLDANNDSLRENIEWTEEVYNGYGLEGINAVGLLVGANRGTIANLKIDYTSDMAVPSLNNDTEVVGNNVLLSASSPQYGTAFGIVSGANFGTISNVRVNVNDNFVGRQQASGNRANNRDSNPYVNMSIVGVLTGMFVSGSISDTYVDLAAQTYVAAAVDNIKYSYQFGDVNNHKWRNGMAITGGMVGYFVGSAGVLSDSYLTGSGTVQSVVFRGDEQGAGKGYNAFSGGITGGKFKFGNGFTNDDGKDMISSAGNTVGGIGNQIQGIVVSWKGHKLDNNNSNDVDYCDNMAVIERDEFGTLIDTANYNGGMPAIALTYDYDSLGFSSSHAKTGISNTGDVTQWVEAYSLSDSDDISVEIKAVDGSFRIEAITNDYQASSDYQAMPSIKENASTSFYYTVGANYTGKYIWSMNSATVYDSAFLTGTADKTTEGEVTRSTFRDYDAFTGAMIYSVAYGGTKTAYEFNVGTMAQYSISHLQNSTPTTQRIYDGNPVNEPTLVLTAADSSSTGSGTISITPQSDCYAWKYSSSGTDIDRADTIYPGQYQFRSEIDVIEDGQVEATYAYLDTTARVIARTTQGIPLTFTVIPAAITVRSDQASRGNWTTEAVFNGSLNTSGYAAYGQQAPSGDIFDAYTYDVNNTTGSYQKMSGTTFSFSDTETTATAGRTYSNFTVYKLNGNDEYVAVGSASASLTVKIDTTAPIVVDTRYYTYSGDAEITVDNIHQFYYDIKEGDPLFTNITDQIGANSWVSEKIFVVSTASDERRSGIDSDGVSVQYFTESSGSSNWIKHPLQVQISYGGGGEEAKQDIDLGQGNAATIACINNSARLRLQLVDVLENERAVDLGTLNIDTVELALNSASPMGYSYFLGPATSALKVRIEATVGASGANVQYLIVDKTDIDDTSAEIPSGYEDAWVTLGAYDSKASYTIMESFADGAAVFVKLSSAQGLFPDQVKRLYAGSGPDTDTKGDSGYPYFYVDLVTKTFTVPYNAITVGGKLLSELAQDPAALATAFAKQYDGNNSLSANTVIKIVDFDSVSYDGEGADKATALAELQKNTFKAVGTYSQFENVGESVLTWEFEVGNDANTGYQFRILVNNGMSDMDQVTVDTRIDYRDYDIGVEVVVKKDPQFADILVTDGSGAATNEIVKTYWGTNESGLPESFGYPTDFGDTMYCRYAYLGGTDGVFNAGGDYLVSVDGVKIVPDGVDPATVEWHEFTPTAAGAADVEQYDNYNIHFTTAMKMTVNKVKANIKTALWRVEESGNVAETLTAQILYDGMTHVVTATYNDIYGVTQNAIVQGRRDGDACGRHLLCAGHSRRLSQL